jgi:thiamine pyrophosphate-dependent acetolactate synthase large subunit-like protein
MTRPRVHAALAESLAALGTDTLFGVVGSGNFRLVEHLTARFGAAYWWARHETAAVTMADAWARVTGRTGVCTVHQGPGLTNALTGLAEAAKARTPMLVLAGDTATTAVSVNQDVDQDRLARAVGAGAERIRSAETAVRDLVRALAGAQAERRPVVLSLPIDLQELECAPANAAALLPPRSTPTRPAEAATRRVADLVEQARRPLVVGGRGAVLAGARAPLEAVADRIGALLATSAPANGLFAGNPFSLGISGGFATPVARDLIARADLILAFGASLNRWTTRHGDLLAPDVRIVQSDRELSAIGAHVPVAEALLGDAAEAARALAEELDRRGVRMPGFRADVDRDALRQGGWEIDDESTADTVDPRTLMLELERRLPPERTVATDAGHFQGWPPLHLSVPDPQAFVFTQAYQSIGLGLATGIGAAIARPERLAVTVVGDGGAMMSLGELDTAVAHGLALLVVVMDDAAYGAEVHHFESLDVRTELAVFGERDFAAVASALGARALTVRSLADLDRRLDNWLGAPDGPLLLDCKINRNVRAEWAREAFRGGA